MKRRPVEIEHRHVLEPAALFKALSDPHRLVILLELARSKGPMSVCDFTARVELDQSTVSHHLKCLRMAGLITARRRGTWAYYTLASGMRERLHTALDSVLSQPVYANV